MQEEIYNIIQILQSVLLPLVGIVIFVAGIWMEKSRPVKYIPCGGPYFTKIKKGPPWLAIFILIDFVVVTTLFILFMLIR